MFVIFAIQLMGCRRWFITGVTPGGLSRAFAEAALEVGDRGHGVVYTGAEGGSGRLGARLPPAVIEAP